jgi:hydrogenase nickel incorporation protein HypB
MCLDCGCAGTPPRQLVLEQRLLAGNDHQAAHNRQHFAAAGVRVINLLSSPGSGKTALLEHLGAHWGDQHPMAVLVGDLATDRDARRLQAAGITALQISTGSGCHLEAGQVHGALPQLALQLGRRGLGLADLELLVIENVGNLVCPAAYDLGETLRVVLLSVCEGEDKPLKYAPMFTSADLVVITKTDLAEAVAYDRAATHRHIAQVAPRAAIVEVSARTGAGVADLLRALLPAAAPRGA